MKKLSIIISVYNASAFLSKCLDSVLNQDLEMEYYELIIINDASTDDSLNIINDYLTRYNNIIFLNNEHNLGVSASRNKGLIVAKGKYITFIDADDEIFPHSLKKILKKLEIEDLDILYPVIYFFDESKSLLKKSKVENGNKVLHGIKQERRTLSATFYKKKIINNTRFPNNIVVGEDTVFNASLQCRAERVAFFELPYYKYLIRPNSLSKKAFTEEGYNGFINAIKILDDFKKSNFSDDNLDAKNYFDKVILVFLTRIVELHILPNLYKQKYIEVKKLLIEKDYWHLAKNIAEKYPYFDSSFSKFAIHQKKLIFKTKVYQFIQKLKP